LLNKTRARRASEQQSHKTKNQGNGRDSDNKNAMNKKFTAESRAYNT
jgi:hypothetical protein